MILAQQVRERILIKILVDDVVQPGPERQRAAFGRAVTRRAAGLETRNRCERALHQPQDLARSELIGALAQAVAAALAAHPLDHTALDERLDNALEIFFRDILPLGDLLERDIPVGLVLGHVDEHTQCVAALG